MHATIDADYHTTSMWCGVCNMSLNVYSEIWWSIDVYLPLKHWLYFSWDVYEETNICYY